MRNVCSEIILFSHGIALILSITSSFFFGRQIMAYIMIPIVQREVDTFVEVVWNSHRIREQKDTFLPDGVPDHIYRCPEKYDLQACGMLAKYRKLQLSITFTL